ncbi:MAG: toll/interleukin-1 receptor domain-containing protein [Comamonadaceae bacterium]|nr:toll/interleukin-1 receptor domain-containing protein [Comamonadaceae bacterium]
MNHDVFLSHAHADKVYADAVCHRLEAASVRCWVAPRDINPSEDWAEAIINALDRVKILVLIFSSSSNNSPQVRREVERAVSKGVAILPFRIEDVPLSKSLEYFISTQHWLDAINGNVEEHLKQLSESVLGLLGHLGPTTVVPHGQVEKAQLKKHEPVFSKALPDIDLSDYENEQVKREPVDPKSPVAEILAPGDTQEVARTKPISQANAPAAALISAEVAAKVETLLAKVLGPIAKLLVKRTLTAGMQPQELVLALSLEIDDETERKQFVSLCAIALQ